MAVNVSVENDIKEELANVKELLATLTGAEKSTPLIQFISIKDFMELTGWSEKTVQEIYNRPDFPCTDFGKEKKAEVHAVIEYFKVPRRKKDD